MTMIRGRVKVAIGAIALVILTGCLNWIPLQRIGMPAPKIELAQTLQVPDGTSVDWAHLQGQVVVLTFFGTWNGKSIKEIRHLNQVANDVRDAQVQFLAVTDESAEKVTEFTRHEVILGWIGLDPKRAMYQSYGVQPTTVPTTWIIGPDTRTVRICKPGTVTAKELLALAKP